MVYERGGSALNVRKRIWGMCAGVLAAACSVGLFGSRHGKSGPPESKPLPPNRAGHLSGGQKTAAGWGQPTDAFVDALRARHASMRRVAQREYTPEELELISTDLTTARAADDESTRGRRYELGQYQRRSTLPDLTDEERRALVSEMHQLTVDWDAHDSEELRSLTPLEAQAIRFTPYQPASADSARRHYNAMSRRWVADELHRTLMATLAQFARPQRNELHLELFNALPADQLSPPKSSGAAELMPPQSPRD